MSLMLLTIWLTVQNEARLLRKDPIVLFMLLLAPVVIITVAGYSLSNLYGGTTGTFRVPVVDADRGPVAAGIIDALRREPAVAIEQVEDARRAQELVRTRDRTPLAIEFPPGTSAAVAEGRPAQLTLYVDPVRRLEVNDIELRIRELCANATTAARAAAQQRLVDSASELRTELDRLAAAINQERENARQELTRRQAVAIALVNAQVDAAIAQAGKDIEATVRLRQQQAWGAVESQLSARHAILLRVQRYLGELKISQQGFETWLATLKEKAGRHASEIPPPPALPPAPSEADLAELASPITPPSFAVALPDPPRRRPVSLTLHDVPGAGTDTLARDLAALRDAAVPTLPGGVTIQEQSAIPGGTVAVNAFDQYVPGFGVTFLMIGMLLGISLTLFDEREWGTLTRLQVGGVPLAGLLLGKLTARFFIGTAQMGVLFVVGWALFGISLGRHPFALVFPTASMAFAAAAFGLVIAAIARAHDSVMPIGTVSSMAMSAIGGCWWPLDFEPAWMRAIAWSLPTTWTMRAFNNLMIRNQPMSSVAWPCAATIGIGVVFLAIGIFAFVKFEE